VRAGEDAVTHRPGDAADLAAAIATLASDPAARLRLGAEARAVSAWRFDARRLAGDFALAYEAASRLAVSHA
jgi:glycosyltransferase involved in cell wall biosynthesis